MSNDRKFCPQCGTAIPAEAPQGLCPKCLAAGLASPTEPDTGPHGTKILQPAPALDAVRAAFPQLDVLELIGRGGMGVVYKARQKTLDRLVALKLLAPERVTDAKFAERFTREAQALARLSHPNIVTIHDFGQAGGSYFLLMEFVDGVNLRQAMKAGRFTPEQALAIVPPVCEALQYAHDRGIVHRDIKPENLLLDKDGRVKIADFGIAKILEPGRAELPVGPENEAAQQRSPTTSETLASAAGTPQYMAPEQKEHRVADRRADIYSLGVVLYELLTGELPGTKLQPPSSRLRGMQIDVRLDEIVLRALEMRPELRYQTAGEFRTQVETIAHTSAVAGAFFQPARSESWEYKSSQTLFGLPLLHVVSGTDPATGKWRVARGVFAFGGIARGVFAFGGRARGIFAFGGIATGFVAIGGISLGVISIGGLALALMLAFGGLAIGPIATGGGAIGYYAAGGTAIGQYAVGGQAISRHVVTNLEAMPAVLRLLVRSMPWTGVLSVPFVLVLVLPSVFVPLWARKKVMEGKGGGGPAAPLASTAPTASATAGESPVSSRFSRTAIVGASWVIFFFIVAPLFIAHEIETHEFWRHGPFASALMCLVSFVFLIPAFIAPFGATLLGYIAATQIRRSAGKLHGLSLAVFDGLLFPLLALDAALWWLWTLVIKILMGSSFDTRSYLQTWNPDIAPALVREWATVATAISALIFDFLIIRAVWRAVNLSATHSSTAAPTAASAADPQQQLYRLMGYRTKWGQRLLKLSLVGFAGFLGFVPGWQPMLMMFAFLGFMGVATVLELIHRTRDAEPDAPRRPSSLWRWILFGVGLIVAVVLFFLFTVAIYWTRQAVSRPAAMRDAQVQRAPLAKDPSSTNETWSPTLAPGAKPDLQQIRVEAQQLMQSGRYEESLQRILWYHRHALEYGENNAVRLSFGMVEWTELARRYPKARQAMIEVRDRDARAFAEGHGYFDLFMEVARLNEALNDEAATLTLLKSIERSDPALAKQCALIIEEDAKRRAR